MVSHMKPMKMDVKMNMNMNMKMRMRMRMGNWIMRVIQMKVRGAEFWIDELIKEVVEKSQTWSNC